MQKMSSLESPPDVKQPPSKNTVDAAVSPAYLIGSYRGINSPEEMLYKDQNDSHSSGSREPVNMVDKSTI